MVHSTVGPLTLVNSEYESLEVGAFWVECTYWMVRGLVQSVKNSYVALCINCSGDYRVGE